MSRLQDTLKINPPNLAPEEEDLSNRTLCSSTMDTQGSLSRDAITPVEPRPVEISLTTVFNTAGSTESTPRLQDTRKQVSLSQEPPKQSFRRTRSYRDSGNSKRNTRRNVGIVIGDFNCLYADELTLQLGERIEIISKDTIVSRNIGWWTGRNSRGKIGIFPAACVKVVSSMTEADGSEQTDSSETERYPLEISFDEVKMKELIGMGGFGKVHRAIYQNEEVAVKVARNTSYDTVRAITEVLSEAEKFAHLAHDNVCALVGVCLVKDVCLVMEYARGGPLSKVLHERNLSLPVDIILNWSKQIASGMEYLHHEAKPPLIHRDLKSSNILLQYVVDAKKLHGNIIKITDFGLAREIEHTTHMSGAGTYPWMAPEVIRSSEFSQKSDVWSFGVVLWELLTGEKPYTGLNMFVVAYGVGHGTLSLPIPVSCPTALRELMTACWNREHSLRPSFTTSKQILNGIENSDFSQTSHQDFHSLQHSWKQEVHKHFEELKKVEQNLEKKEEELLSKMRVQEQRVTQIQSDLIKKETNLQKKEADLQQMMTDLREHYKELSKQREKRPPRIKRFSPRRLIEWLTDTRRKTGPSASDESTSTTMIVAAGDNDSEAENTGTIRRASKGNSKDSGYHPVTKELRRKGQDLMKQPPKDFHVDPTNKKTSLGALDAKRGHRRQHSDSAYPPVDRDSVTSSSGVPAVQTDSSTGSGRGDVFLIEPPLSVSPRPGSSPLSQKRTIVDNPEHHKKRSSMPTPSTTTLRNRSCSEPSVDTMGLNRHSAVSPPTASPRAIGGEAAHVQMSLQKAFSCSPQAKLEMGSPDSPKPHVGDDSGKGSISSLEISRGKLIDFNYKPSRPVKKSPRAWDAIADFDPLVQGYQQQQSEDSLFSSGNSTFSTSPDTHQPSGISPRQSFSQISDYNTPASPSTSLVRPRYRPSSTHSTKSSYSSSSLHRQESLPHPGQPGPLQRSVSGKLRQQTSHSPTGSVKSVPQYPTYYSAPDDWDISFFSDSSATGSMQGSTQDLTGLDLPFQWP